MGGGADEAPSLSKDMANYQRLKRRYHVGSRVFYQGDVADLDKWSELARMIREDEELEKKLTRAPKDKMVRASGMKTK